MQNLVKIDKVLAEIWLISSMGHFCSNNCASSYIMLSLCFPSSPGMQPPPPKDRRRRLQPRDQETGTIAELAVRPSMLTEADDKRDAISNEFDWDSDFESNSSQVESRTLLKTDKDENADR